MKMEIGFKKVACNLLGITARSYSNWDKEKRPVITLLEKNYLHKKDIEEFLEKGKIEKFELIKGYSVEELRDILSYNRKNDDFYIRNFAFKCSNLAEFEKILLIIILQNNIINSKEDLLSNLKQYSYLEQHVKQLKDIARFDLKSFLEKIKIPSNKDKDKLYSFIDNYLSNEEVVAFCKDSSNIDIL